MYLHELLHDPSFATRRVILASTNTFFTFSNVALTITELAFTSHEIFHSAGHVLEP